MSRFTTEDFLHEQKRAALLDPNDDGEGIAPIESRLRYNILRMPEEVQQASGIVVFGRRIKSLIFSTDVAIIRNCDADAVFCVYPFTAQRAVSAEIIHAASAPVFCGCGGGVTQGTRAVYLARDAENQGAMGVVFNDAFPDEDLSQVARVVDVPIIITVASERTDVASRVANGASIINVAAGKKTPELVASIRKQFPKLPIIATGGKASESLVATIEAGANAIVFMPPSPAELYRVYMESYRNPQ